MNDERFFDLAMKVIARQCTDAERAEMDAMLTREPQRSAEFAQLQAYVRMAKGALPFVDATQATAGELPAYARGRLQTKVRQTLGRPETAGESSRDKERSAMWAWQKILGLVAATAVVVLVAMPMFREPSGPMIQVAMLDMTGGTRGSDTNETEILKQQWKNSAIQSFNKPDLLENWETNWPGGDKVTAKVIYDRAAGEVRVLLHEGGKSQQKTFTINQDLVTTMQEASNFIREQTKR